VTVTPADVRQAVERAGLGNSPICLHSSLASFGQVVGGSSGVVDGILASGATLMVPTFSSEAFAVLPPPADLRPARNGISYETLEANDTGRVFAPSVNDIDARMGAIPADLLGRPGRERGNHPGCSFSAIGPLAAELVGQQGPVDVYAPLAALMRLGGWVVLAGVGLDRMTLIHHAEAVTGRTLFRRWARLADGRVGMVAVGGCSDGFERLAPWLAAIETDLNVGSSRWRIFPANEVVDIVAALIQVEPTVACCADPTCQRCKDAAVGGPVLDEHNSLEEARGAGTV
jgi:aminoglycoside 3-N-acetyltransferase